MTVALVRALKQAHAKRTAMMSSSAAHTKDKEDLTLSVVVVVIIFVIANFFSPIRRILMWQFPEPEAKQCGGVIFYFELSSLGLLFSCASNFLIYIVCAKRFRQRAWEVCFRCRQNQVQPTDVSSHTPGTASSSSQQEDTKQKLVTHTTSLAF